MNQAQLTEAAKAKGFKVKTADVEGIIAIQPKGKRKYAVYVEHNGRMLYSHALNASMNTIGDDVEFGLSLNIELGLISMKPFGKQ